MAQFEDLDIGDMFNVKNGRFVKIDERCGICVMSAVIRIGQIAIFVSSDPVIVLYTSKQQKLLTLKVSDYDNEE